MKAESKEALKLAEEWWGDKEVPSYIKINQFEMSDVDVILSVHLLLNKPRNLIQREYSLQN